MPGGVSLFGDWEKAKKVLSTVQDRWEHASRRALMQEAHFLRGKIVEGMREQAPGGKAFEPLSPLSIAMRKAVGFKGTKALINRGDMRNAVVVVAKGEGAFVGILRTAKGRDGKPLVNVAEANEYGRGPFIVPITPKSRRFYHAAMAKAGFTPIPTGHPGAVIAIVRIPARPFFRPVFEKFGNPSDVRDRFFKRIAKDLAGDLGG